LKNLFKIKIMIKLGTNFFGLLTIVFIVLKLTNVITWGWFWVLFPFTIPVTIFLSVIFVPIIYIYISIIYIYISIKIKYGRRKK